MRCIEQIIRMEIEKIVTGKIQENAYLFSLDSEVAFCVDPGAEAEKIRLAALKHAWKIKYVLLTHGHFDHIGAAAQMQKDGAQIVISSLDAPMCGNNKLNLGAYFGCKTEPFKPDLLIEKDEIITLGNVTIHAYLAPGHTCGGVCYLVDDVLFSGDTLFRLSVGRTDFPGGSAEALEQTLNKKIFLLDEKIQVLPGHGEATTIKYEKENNPFSHILIN